MSQINKKLNFNLDPFGILSSCWQVQKAWLSHPQKLTEELAKLEAEIWSLEEWQRITGAGSHGDLFPAAPYDERFQLSNWTENPYLDTLKESYLLYTRWLEDAIFETPDVPEKTKKKAAFWARQVLNALAPTNWFWTNPEAMARFFESNGISAVNGCNNYEADADRGVVSLVDEYAFEVGVNLATTPGAVVFRNELLELIQYAPTTDKVHRIPILIVAPWINKYYILDLDEQKSLIRFLVSQGFTVFVTSWKNPGPEMRNTTLDEYMLKGVLEAVTVAKKICKVPNVHLTGYCVGGTIVSALMAWINAKDSDDSPVAHWTLLASLVDFSDPGDIDVFIDEDSVQLIEQLMERKGYLDGKDMAMSFRMLRSNSLIWHYFVNNYLYGEPPEAFDVLYWNMDTTRIPEAMHSFYLRELYLNNKLVEKNGLTLGERPIDLGSIIQPLYVVGTEQDHITPWKETFKICELVSGKVRYVLATSGHILGTISPPIDPAKRRYWAGDLNGTSDPESWLAQTDKIRGSWWTDWVKWLRPNCGDKEFPPPLGGGKYSPILDAPGTYVLER